MTQRKPFPLADILSVVAVSKCTMLSAPRTTFKDMLRFMRNVEPNEESMMFPQEWLIMAIGCGIALRKDYPYLNTVEFPDTEGDLAYHSWLKNMKAQYGETLPVREVTEEDMESYRIEIDRVFDWWMKSYNK